MELDWLKDYIALTEHGNFSRAASARHVTQPAFSRRVRALEDWIGTPLFIRSAQGATLTAAGETFYPLALDLLADVDRSRRETLAAAEQQTTSLAIAATHALSYTFFPSWIGRYIDSQSFGKLSLLSDSMEACEQTMLSGEVHFLLCHWRNNMKSLLGSDRYCSVVIGRDVLTPVSARTEHGDPLWPACGTMQQPTRILGYSPSSGLGRILASMSSFPIKADATETIFTSHLAATLLAMAKDRKGMAWLPMTLVKEDLDQGRLVKAGDNTLDIEIDIRLFRSPDCRNRAADALWEALTAPSAAIPPNIKTMG